MKSLPRSILIGALRWKLGPTPIAPRLIDLFVPIGFGQRALVVSPPKAGKTTILRQIAAAVMQNYHDASLFLCLVDERPEEVTEWRMEVQGPNVKLYASSFDQQSARHGRVVEQALNDAKRLVEQGKDVVILLDSLTRLVTRPQFEQRYVERSSGIDGAILAAAHFQVELMLMLWKLGGAFLVLLVLLRKAVALRLSQVAWLKLAAAWTRLSMKNLRALATLRFASHANWQIAGSFPRLICQRPVLARKSVYFHLQSYALWRSCAAKWQNYPVVRLLSK